MHAFHVMLSVLGAGALVWGYARLRAACLYRSEVTTDEARVWAAAPPAAGESRSEPPHARPATPRRNDRVVPSGSEAPRER